MDEQKKRETTVRNLKKNVKLLVIALVVLAIEKLSEFCTAVVNGTSDPTNLLCQCNANSTGQ